MFLNGSSNNINDLHILLLFQVNVTQAILYIAQLPFCRQKQAIPHAWPSSLVSRTMNVKRLTIWNNFRKRERSNFQSYTLLFSMFSRSICTYMIDDSNFGTIHTNYFVNCTWLNVWNNFRNMLYEPLRIMEDERQKKGFLRFLPQQC